MAWARILLLVSAVQISAALGPAVTAGLSPPDICSVSKPVRLAAGTAESSVSLRVRDHPGREEPCVVHISAADLNFLKLDVLPSTGQNVPFPPSDVLGDVEDVERGMTTGHARCSLRLTLGGEVPRVVELCDAASVRAARDLVMKEQPENISLEWTPGSEGLRRPQVHTIIISAHRKGVPSYELCSVTTNLKLAPHGLGSAVRLELRGSAEGRPCRVNIAAPDTYLLSLLLVSASRASPDSSRQVSDPLDEGHELADDNAAREFEDFSQEKRPPSCGLSLLLGCSEAEAWSVDLCDPAQSALLLFTELFPNNVTLVWTPPRRRGQSPQLATAVLLTAVGKGRMCSSSQFSACWSRARFQLCVASALACDGYHNCPMDGNGDEDPLICLQNDKTFMKDGFGTDNKEEKGSPSFVELIRQAIIQSNSNRQTHNQSFNVEESSQQDVDPTPDTLSNYGPWGYLMLGMLVCGAFLMLCGLWECCCRQPKPTPSTPSHIPTTVLMPSVSPGSVLVLDSDLDDDPSRPPPYDDLDQPPAYGALFPGQPKEDVVSPPTLTLPPPASPSPASPDVEGATPVAADPPS